MDKQLVEKLVKRLVERDETLSIAESCTGGLCSAHLVTYPGVSQVFLGSIVAYSNKVKEQYLGVSGNLLKSLGAVSTPVAIRMAAGARQGLDSTWAIAITGVAGPSGGSARKPVGTVCFAVVGPGVELATQQHFDGSREQVQGASAEYALRLLLEQL